MACYCVSCVHFAGVKITENTFVLLASLLKTIHLSNALQQFCGRQERRKDIEKNTTNKSVCLCNSSLPPNRVSEREEKRGCLLFWRLKSMWCLYGENQDAADRLSAEESTWHILLDQKKRTDLCSLGKCFDLLVIMWSTVCETEAFWRHVCAERLASAAVWVSIQATAGKHDEKELHRKSDNNKTEGVIIWPSMQYRGYKTLHLISKVKLGTLKTKPSMDMFNKD